MVMEDLCFEKAVFKKRSERQEKLVRQGERHFIRSASVKVLRWDGGTYAMGPGSSRR